MILSIKYLLITFVKFIKNIKHLRLTPKKKYHNDLYLVSFPRSGSTWLSFLIANIIAIKNSINYKITQFNIHMWLPDIHVTRNIAKNLKLQFPFYRIIKSHSIFNPYYNYVLYLIRDPRDVLISYHKFLTQQNSYDGSLSYFIRDKKYGIKAWVDHIDSWWTIKSAAISIFFIKYEDIKNDPEKLLKDIFINNLGLDIETENFTKAIAKSNFKKLKKEEKN